MPIQHICILKLPSSHVLQDYICIPSEIFPFLFKCAKLYKSIRTCPTL
uniref:Uncharacterized protein n=1 Tax=Arundo donax TaxID=35708 RepID=A0A0A9GRU3_ARUDO